MKALWKLLPGLALVGAAACADNPILEPDIHAEDLDVELEFSLAELATLTEMEVEVSVTDDDGAPYIDFESVAFEFRLEGEEAWAAVELVLHDGHFTAEQMFYTSGEYETRVTAMRHGSDHTETIFQAGEHLEVERIHMEVGEFRVEMETFPGHIDEGDEAEVRFWITEAGSDGHTGGHAMGGLEAEIHLTHGETGASMQHMGAEHSEGVYEAEHHFDEAGVMEISIDFEDAHGDHHEAAFHVPVSHHD